MQKSSGTLKQKEEKIGRGLKLIKSSFLEDFLTWCTGSSSTLWSCCSHNLHVQQCWLPQSEKQTAVKAAADWERRRASLIRSLMIGTNGSVITDRSVSPLGYVRVDWRTGLNLIPKGCFYPNALVLWGILNEFEGLNEYIVILSRTSRGQKGEKNKLEWKGWQSRHLTLSTGEQQTALSTGMKVCI